MKHKIFVPVMKRLLDEEERVKVIERLHQAQVDGVYLITEWNLTNSVAYARELEELREHIPIFEQEGFEVGVWIGSTIGHGAPLAGDTVHQSELFRTWMGVSGNPCEGNFCPSDEKFSSAICNWIQDVAKAGAKLILLDDDFRMTVRGDSLGCLCDWHLQEFNRLIGESLTREEVRDKVFTGPANFYRDTWMKLQGDTLREFAKKIRKSADEVDENIRMGYCCSISSFDVEGVDAIELTHIFAGKNEPFLRLCGAPYWGKMDSTMLSFSIETERLVQSWCDGEGFHTLSELDTYPRPRYTCPVAFVEAEQEILIADGRMSGSLKYMLDYTASCDYEPGYLDAHCRNLSLYQEIEQSFQGKKAAGLNIFEVKNKLKDMEWPAEFCGVDQRLGGQLLPPASIRWMRNLSIPLTYDNPCGVNVVFGENAAYVTAQMRKQGMILNMRAARILRDKGIDVGFTEMSYAGIPQKEHYLKENETIAMTDGIGVYLLEHKPGVRVVTEFQVGDRIISGVYEYENADGERYVILPFWEYNAENPSTSLSGYAPSSMWGAENSRGSMMRNYCRQRQMIQSIEWLAGKPLDAVCLGHPYLYILVKKDADSMTVGLWNLSVDKVIQPVVTLGETYHSVKTVCCDALLDGKQVKIQSEIAALECAILVLEK